MSTWYIALILGAIMLRFNEEKFVKVQQVFYVQQAILIIFSPLKRIRLHEEVRKAGHEEYSRFCSKIWCRGKNLTSKQKNGNKNELQA